MLQIVMLDEKLLTGPVDEVAVVVRGKLGNVRILDETVRTVHESYLYEIVGVLARVETHSLVVTIVLWQPATVYKVVC
tara:strand:+ start:63 stop:296 length:234 start_codon:yes stop_codon:yes gene_type:complete